MNKKVKSTYDRLVEKLSPEKLKEMEQDYENLLLSEIILATMNEDGITVRKLAEEAGISPTIIQGVRSGTRKISAQSLFKIFKGLGYNLIAERDGKIIHLANSKK